MSESSNRVRTRSRAAAHSEEAPAAHQPVTEVQAEGYHRTRTRAEVPQPAARPERVPLRYVPPVPAQTAQPRQQRMPQQPGVPQRRVSSGNPYAQRKNAPASMNRPQAVRRQDADGYDINRRAVPVPQKVPLWMIICVGVLFFVSLGLFTAKCLMQGYLTQRQQERQAAYQAVVDAHPISWQSCIETYAEENNLQPAFVAAIIMNESSFRPTAESSVGARGLMQLMPDTAQWIAHKLKVDNYSFEMMYDPETNIRFGCWYLGYLARLFRGDPASVTAAYHAGQGQVTTWLSSNRLSSDGVTLDLNAMEDGPTKSYARKVTQAYGIYQVLYFEDPAADDAGDGASVG